MARMRTVKPGLRTSRVVASWPREVRYAWVLLWGYLDDKGRGHDIPKAIAGDCFPYDDDITAAKMQRWLTLMATTGNPDRDPPLCRYQVGGRRYLHALYWNEHQRPNRPNPSVIPPCPIHEGFTESSREPIHATVLTESLSDSTEDQCTELEGLSIRELEGAAREPLRELTPAADPEAPPPDRCPKHLDDPDPPPCTKCRDARQAYQRWEAAQGIADLRRASDERSAAAHDRAAANAAAIARCRDCDDRGYLPNGQPCPHDPGLSERAHRGAAAARAALAGGAA